MGIEIYSNCSDHCSNRHHTITDCHFELQSSAKLLTSMLVEWMIHSPVKIIPSRIQIDLVTELLRQRGDVEELGKLLKMCRADVKS